MSKTWYPVIDYEKCIECGACIDKCKHGVCGNLCRVEENRNYSCSCDDNNE